MFLSSTGLESQNNTIQMIFLWLANECLSIIINTIGPDSIKFVKAHTIQQKIVGAISKFIWENYFLGMDLTFAWLIIQPIISYIIINFLEYLTLNETNDKYLGAYIGIFLIFEMNLILLIPLITRCIVLGRTGLAIYSNKLQILNLVPRQLDN
jgi:hypothetical protein